MNPHSLFLRTTSVLPKNVALPQYDLCRGWVSIEPENAQEVDVKIRAAGWHFMWLVLNSSGVGVGLTSDDAISKALHSALDQLSPQFNAAELITVSIRKYPGVHVARVKLASRHIQEYGSLGRVDEAALQQLRESSEPQAA